MHELPALQEIFLSICSKRNERIEHPKADAKQLRGFTDPRLTSGSPTLNAGTIIPNFHQKTRVFVGVTPCLDLFHIFFAKGDATSCSALNWVVFRWRQSSAPGI